MTVARGGRSPWPMDPGGLETWTERVFPDMMRGWFTPPTLLERFFDAPTTGRIADLMRVEEYCDGDTCVIRAELPGIDPAKDVDITVADGALHIAAHREERSEDKQDDSYRSEFRYGKFERHVQLPQGASGGDVKASYKDGILEVRVPVPTSVPAGVKVPIEQAK